MIPDNNQHIIVESSHGSFQAFPCTMENARKLFSNHLCALSAELKALGAARRLENKYFVSHDRIASAFQEVISAEVGTSMRALRVLLHGRIVKDVDVDSRPEVVLTQEMKDGFVLWCFKQKLNVDRLEALDCRMLTREANAGTLPFSEGLLARAKGRDIVVAEDWALEASDELLLLEDGTRWKDSAKEHSVVQRYLNFINDHLVNSRYTEYQVAPLVVTP